MRCMTSRSKESKARSAACSQAATTSPSTTRPLQPRVERVELLRSVLDHRHVGPHRAPQPVLQVGRVRGHLASHEEGDVDRAVERTAPGPIQLGAGEALVARVVTSQDPMAGLLEGGGCRVRGSAVAFHDEDIE